MQDFEKQKEKFEEEVLEVRRVFKVTKGGRTLRFRVALVIGDRQGQVGFSVAKANEVPQAVEKARNKAKKQLVSVPIVGDTIPFDIDIKFKRAQVFLKPASEGTGLIVGRSIRPLIELAGIKNILSKIKGSRDKVANAYAVIKAFKKLNDYYKKLAPDKTIKTKAKK